MTDNLFGKVLQEGRITIPKEIMKEYNIKEGDFVIFNFGPTSFQVIPAKVIPR